MKSLSILVFATGKAAKLCATIKERGHSYTLIHPSDVDLFLSDGQRGDHVYVNGSKLFSSKYDAVITRIGENRDYAAKVLYHLQHNLKMFCTQSGKAILTCADKWDCAQRLSENGIRVPKQVYSLRGQYPAFMIKKVGGLPVIVKPNGGSKGNGVVFVNNTMTANMLLESLYNGGNNRTILQEYINTGSTQSDERHIFVRGHGVVNSMRRNAPKEDIRANLSQSGTGEKITPDAETEKFVTDICDALHIDFAGVDVMRVKEGDCEKLYAIEVNSNPGELIIDVCQHNHYIELLQFVEDNCHKKQPERADGAAHETAAPAPMNAPTGNFPPAYDSTKSPMENKRIREEWAKQALMKQQTAIHRPVNPSDYSKIGGLKL